MARTPARLALALFALATALAAAPVAQAGTASVQGSTVVYTDDPGASRTINWARDATSIAISEATRDTGKVTATAGAGCVVDKRNDFSATYVCSASGVTDVRIELGDGDDSAEASNTSAFSPPRYFEDLNFPVTVLGGDGNDEITGGPAADTLDGGPGDDALSANRDTRNGGGDSAANPASDTMIGGPGNDTIQGGKSIDAGDGDDTVYASNLGASIVGGPGKDTIQAGKGDDTVDAGDGDDQIDTGDGNDTINAGEGNDTIDSGVGNDTVDGGGGADNIDARQGDDKLSGGDGPDTLDGGPGADTYSGGAGDDKLVSDDGAKDVLDCGAGDDTVTGWDRGKDKAVPRESCEHVPEVGLEVRGSLVRGSLVLGYAAAAKSGRMKVRFRCVDCETLKVNLVGWQFWFVPNKPGLAIGANCAPGKTINLKRTKLDQFDGVIRLTPCERVRLRLAVGQERAGKARLRRFEFNFTTGAHSTGWAYIGGKR